MISQYPTHRVAAYGLLVVCGFTGALVIGRPEPALLAVPFVTMLFTAVTGERPRVPRVMLSVDRTRAVEGDEVALSVSVDPPDTEVLPVLPDGVTATSTAVTDGGLRITLRLDTWGVFDVGTVAVRTTDASGAWRTESLLHAPVKIRVHPEPARLPPDVVAALDLQPHVGHHPSRARGEGFEFADLRPYRYGARARSINWRATARRGTTWVNERHPDRASEIVVMLDTFGSSEPARRASLDLAVRAVAAVAEAYNLTHDRIGLMTFGGHLRWLQPGSGRRQVMRIVDALLDTELLLTDVWKDVNRVPVGAIPPRSLLLAVTPLQSDTELHTLADLRARGFDVAVIAVAAAPVSGASDDATVRLGQRLDDLARDARRLQLERLGIAVSIATHSLAASLKEVDECRRRMPRVRV